MLADRVPAHEDFVIKNTNMHIYSKENMHAGRESVGRPRRSGA